MAATVVTAPTGPAQRGPRRGLRRGVAAALHNRPRVRLLVLLSLPLLWLGVVYLGSLAAMLFTAGWMTDDFTGAIVKTFTWDNFSTLLHDRVYRTIALRTVLVALAVTLIDAAIALPMALFMAKVAKPRWRPWLVVAVLTPLWASYLVKAYAWRMMLGHDGLVNWALKPLGLSGPGYGLTATVITLAYLWLPYMILPVYAGLERLPESLLEASSDLGARPGKTFRRVVLPLLFPAVVAGSIFTFSLTLGDYITVKIVGGSTQLFANVIADNIGAANNLPFAAAAAVFPIVVMLLYLAGVRRTGALDNL